MTRFPSSFRHFGAAAVCALLQVQCTAVMALTMPMVPVNHTGHAADTVVAYNGTVPRETTTGLGSVARAYWIGQ